MTAENEYWMSQIMRESPALYELLRDFGYSKADWDALDASEKEELKGTAASCYRINHGIAPVEPGSGRNTGIPSPITVEVSACKLW